VDGEGFDGVLVAAPNWGGTPLQEGRVHLYSGGPGGLGVAPQSVWDPTDQAESQFGIALAGGDIDQDGYADVEASSLHYDAEATNEDASTSIVVVPRGLRPTRTGE
jgi:hypothetical protein